MASESWLTSNPLGKGGGSSGGGYTTDNSNFNNAYAAYFQEERRRWDSEYDLKQKSLDQQYSIAKTNAKTAQQAQAADEWYKKASIQLAQERLAQDKFEFEQTHGLNQAKLGYGLLETAASLRGPADYYQAAEYARGVSQMPQTATFLTALQNNARLPGFNAQGGLPDPETLDTLTAKLTGGNTAGNAVRDGNNLAVIGNIAAKGAHQLGAGALENLTATERQLFTSGLDRLGVDTPTFLEQYARSRIGQGTAGNRAA